MLATWGCTTFPKPTLSLDFLGATSLDSGITFSRGSQATLFDSTGTLVYAKQNLLLQSQALTTSPWITTNLSAVGSKIAPDGTATAIAITATGANGRTRQPVTVVAGQTYTHSMFVRRVTGSGSVTLAILDSGGTALFSTVLSLTSEWQRFTVSGAPAVTSILAGIIIATSTDAIEVWGAQLNQNPMEGGVTSSLTTYYPTTTAAYYAPRFDYDPSTLQPRGLLIEEQRTNLFPASNDFANATYWTVYGTAVATAGAGTGPDGLNSAVNLAGATDITLSGNNIEEVITVSASTAYGFSVFVKSNGGTTVTLRLRDSTGGSSSSSPFTVTSSWTRISLNRTMAVGATSVRCIIGATNGDILIYGAQLEAGAFATSYIPTTTTALTRNADVATMTGTNFSSWYNQSEGTFVGYATTLKASAVAAPILIAQVSGGNDRHQMAVYTQTVATVVGGAVQVAMGANTNATARTAYAYKLNDYATSTNGGAVVTDTSATVPTVNYLSIGKFDFGGGESLSGHIQRISYYPVRLVGTTLQALTA